jgi:hypothetical protein
VLYFSDFDPSGYQMPVSVSRKLQALRDLWLARGVKKGTNHVKSPPNREKGRPKFVAWATRKAQRDINRMVPQNASGSVPEGASWAVQSASNAPVEV